MAQDGYIEFLLELMAGLEGVSARRMFGGHGIYRHGLMIGLVADDTLFLKVDEESRSEFEQRELGPFVYHKGERPFAMSYHLAPPEALEEPDEMIRWAGLAFDAAQRQAKKKAGRGAKSQERSRSSKKKQPPARKSKTKRTARTLAKKVKVRAPLTSKKVKRKVSKTAAKKLAKKIAGKAAKKTARKAVSKVVKKTAKKTAKKAAKETSNKVAKQRRRA